MQLKAHAHAFTDDRLKLNDVKRQVEFEGDILTACLQMPAWKNFLAKVGRRGEPS